MTNRSLSALGGLVYSTDKGRMCPDCRQALENCQCRSTRDVVIGDGRIRVGREKKGRGGKTVTLVRGLAMDAAQLLALSRRLKSHCGSGGTVSDGVIEIQGDHVERVLQSLLADGLLAKRTGS